MTKDEALQLALEALEHMCEHTRAKSGYKNTLVGKALDNIKEALALTSTQCEEQPAQEPPVDFELAYGEIYANQREALAKALAQPMQEPLEINGLTRAQTDASMSVRGLSKSTQKAVAWLVEFENGEQELHFEPQSVGESCVPLCVQSQWVCGTWQ